MVKKMDSVRESHIVLSLLIITSIKTVSVLGQCTNPPAVSGATIVTTGPYNVGDTADYLCCTNCKLTAGSQNLRCNNNGWQKNPPECNPIGSTPCDCSTTTTGVVTTTTAVPTTTTVTTTTTAPTTTTSTPTTTTAAPTTTTAAPTTTTAAPTTTTAAPTTTTAAPTTTTAAPTTTTAAPTTTTASPTTTTAAPTTTTAVLTTTTAAPTTTTAVPATTAVTTTTAAVILSTPSPVIQRIQIFRTIPVNTEGVPDWAIGLLAALSALLLGSLLAALLALCCCCNWCPCYRCRCCRKKKYKQDDDIEYYYDEDRQCYVNPHNWQAIFSRPTSGLYLGSYKGYNKPQPNGSSAKTSEIKVKSLGYPVVTTAGVPVDKQPLSVVVVPNSGNKNAAPAPATPLVTLKQKPSPDMKTAIILPQQISKLHDPNYIVLNGQPKPIADQPNYIVLNGATTSTSNSEPNYKFIPVNSKSDHSKVIYTTAKPAETHPTNTIPLIVHQTQPHTQNPVLLTATQSPERNRASPIYVVNKQPPAQIVRDQREPVSAPIVIIDQRGRDSSSDTSEKSRRPKNLKVTRSRNDSFPRAKDYPECDDDTSSGDDLPDESPNSETSPPVKRDFLKSNFRTAIDRVLGINMFKKKSTPKTGVWMPHAKPVRTTGGMKNTSTK